MVDDAGATRIALDCSIPGLASTTTAVKAAVVADQDAEASSWVAGQERTQLGSGHVEALAGTA